MNPAFPESHTWRRGQLLAFSALDGRTDYAFGLTGRTIARPEGIEITLPDICRIVFCHPPGSEIVFGGDFFEHGGVRGAFLDARHFLLEGDVRMEETGKGIEVLVEDGRTLVGAAGLLDPALLRSDLDVAISLRRSWVEEKNLSSERTLRRALIFMKGQVCSPEGAIPHRWTTPDRWPHRDMWLWDTAFHAIGWRHVDAGLAMEMIEALFALQREDGFLTYRGSPEGVCGHLGNLVTQPPVLALAVRLVYEKSRDDNWLARMFPRLAAYVAWDLRHRDRDGGGLMEWFIEDDESCRCGESGMDNSPRFDAARRLDAVDFNALLARECEELAWMAAKLGREAEIQPWKERSDTLCQLINERCWSDRDGFYFDFDPLEKAQSSVWASAGFLPLLCAAPTAAQALALAGHLRNPEKFGTALPVPSVAADDHANYAKDMWRGPVWVCINWLVAEGFERHGLDAEAAWIRGKTLCEIERTCEKFGVFFEYFDDRGEVEPPELLRKGECNPDNPYRQAIHDFGWTATLFADLTLRKFPRS